MLSRVGMRITPLFFVPQNICSQQISLYHNDLKKDFNTVNLLKNEPLHHMFYDQMKITSKLFISPNILMTQSLPELKINKIYFEKIKYYDFYNPTFNLTQNDIRQIQCKYSFLYNHSKFIPRLPYLGYNIVNNNKNWYLWSYTDIVFVNNKIEFLDKFYEFNFHKDKIINENVIDYLLNQK